MKLKNIITVGTILFLLILVKNVGSSIYEHFQNESVVHDLQDKLVEEKREKAFLNQRLSEVKSDAFVEQEARKKLGLVRENEQPVFLTPPSPTPTPLPELQASNIQKWRKLFQL